MIVVYILAWWAVGIATMLWLVASNDPYFTWEDVAKCVLIGVLGPALALLIGFVVLMQADFWSKPVFKRQKRGE